MSTMSNLGAVISPSRSISGHGVQSCKDGEGAGEDFVLLPNTSVGALRGKNGRKDKARPALVYT